MNSLATRRDFLRLAGLGGGVVFASALQGGALRGSIFDDFHFVQLSDTHWGYEGPAANKLLILGSFGCVLIRCRHSG